MTLADRIKAARSYAKLTQPALSLASGVRQQVISKLERGLQKETADIVKIAKACRVRPEWLDDEDGPMFYYEGARATIQESLRVMEALPEELIEENLRNLKTLSRLSNKEPLQRPTTAVGPVRPSIGPLATNKKAKEAT